MSLISKIFGDPNDKYIQKLMPVVEKINILEKEFEKIPIEQLKNKTIEFKDRVRRSLGEGGTNKEVLDEILPEAFALVREAAKRTIGQRHFDVQLIGGIVLHRGQISEMKTGEGKTLVATLPLYLNSLANKGCHLVTVNDYLARRDAVWMGQIYNALGLSVGILNHEASYLYDPTPVEKDEERDELGSFKVVHEFLKPCSRREAYLADITYGTNNEFGFDYLKDNLVYSLDETVQTRGSTQKPIALRSDADQRGNNQRESALFYAIVDEIDSILIDEARTPLIISTSAEESAEMYSQLARLIERLKETEDYEIDEKMKAVSLTEAGQEKIIRLLGQDPWEMSASLDLDQKTKGFNLDYHITAALRAKANFTKDKDYVVRDNEVIIVDEFTGRLMIGRRYSEGLHQAIEAKEKVLVQKESKTLATITFQNYFKMYEKLGGMTGTAVTEAEEFYKIYNLEVVVIPTNRPMIRIDLSDKIYATEVAKFKAVAKEAKEKYKTGQPLLIGTTSIEKNEFLGQLLEREGVPHQMLNAKNHEKEAQIIAQAGKLGAVTCATNMAGRGVDIVLGGNPLDKEEQKKIKELGGLCILGTECHEARRIDNQLRGRAGRQGDQGMSQFFISMEDDLMRIFGGDRLKKIMQTISFPQDMAIENSFLSRSIEQAQKKVEGYNFDIRQHLLDYDNVLAKHREAIYRLRKETLDDAGQGKIKEIVLKMVEEEIENIIGFHTNHDERKSWEIDRIGKEFSRIFPLPSDWQNNFAEILKQSGVREDDVQVKANLFDYFFDLVKKAYEFLEGKYTKETFSQINKFLVLKTIDTFWIMHLETIENLKGGIGLRAYGQRDPLVEYKKEAYFKFSNLLDEIRQQVVYSLFKISIDVKKVETIERPKEVILSGAETGEGEVKLESPPSSRQVGISADARFSNSADAERKSAKVGRNDPCPCGSGKKYKKCCGK